ncbi:hypothetical protein VTN77DRAFT_895 [Rasamsonia byssochlamydoides]|uniref:uncharacterized protein n=1 Tax=Rasamsonia byssochlamydoides TaxID=89139 RepID=UPI0037437260
MSSVSTAPLDPKVSAILDQKNPADTPDDLDEDALFEALEKEDDSAYRAQRIEQLHSELASAKVALQQRASSGTNPTNTLYPTLPNDQALLDLTTNAPRCVVHFSHPDFARCSVMDEHLRILASRHYEVRFARVDVRDCPFVVEKLNIRVLPCVIGFIDGVSKERIVGFEGLGGGFGSRRDGVDGFQTPKLEKRLLKNGVLVREKLSHGGDGRGGRHNESSDSEDDNERRRGIRSGNARHNNRNKNDDDDDEDDWE